MTNTNRYQNTFKQLKQIGQGGFDFVFRVIEKASGNEFAVKKIEFQSQETTLDFLFNKIESFFKENNDDFNEFLKREIDLLPKQSSEYVVKYFDSWIENDIAYIQFELMDGNLESILKIKDIAFNSFQH